MAKYHIEVYFKSGQVSVCDAEQINFHSGMGGIDIFDFISPIPFFPGYEKDVKEIKITILENK